MIPFNLSLYHEIELLTKVSILLYFIQGIVIPGVWQLPALQTSIFARNKKQILRTIIMNLFHFILEVCWDFELAFVMDIPKPEVALHRSFKVSSVHEVRPGSFNPLQSVSPKRFILLIHNLAFDIKGRL